jgi:Protein of unknown function (DUF4238)
MSGKKQHFIPRHFLKAFISSDGSDHIWMYRRGHVEPVLVKRDRVAAQEHFYSNPSADGVPTLDDLITAYEYELKAKVDQMRCLALGEPVDADNVAEVVAHLTVRSSHMRSFVAEAAVTLVSTIGDMFTDSESAIKLPDPTAYEVPKPIRDTMRKELRSRHLLKHTNVTEETVVRLLYFYFREKRSEIVSGVSPAISLMVDFLIEKSASVARASHSEVLRTAMAPAARIQQLVKLKWKIVEIPKRDGILPDCVSLSFDGQEWKPLLFADPSRLRAVILLISPDRAALGKAENCPDLDLSTYNSHAASACFTFFLSHQKESGLSARLSDLGAWVRSEIEMLTHDAIAEAASSFLQAQPGNHEIPGQPFQDNSRVRDQSGHAYQISFKDCADQETAESVAEIIKSIVQGFSSVYPIDGLDGFTFAYDLTAALNDVDRGIPNAKPIYPTERGIGVPLTVVRAGKIKTRAVLRSQVAQSLLSEDQNQKQEAVSAVIYMLAHNTFTFLMAERFPENVLQHLDDAFEGAMFSYTSNVFPTYFSYRISSGGYDYRVFEQEFIDLIRGAKRRAPLLNLEYQKHRDHNLIFTEVAADVSGILTAGARLLAISTAQEHSASEDLAAELEGLDLLEWFELFGSDLQAFFAGIEHWCDFRHAFFVNRHFERLSVQFGVILDKLDGEHLYIHVFPPHVKPQVSV